MSSVSGAVNSIGTLVSYDLLKRWRPGVSDRTLVSVGRWSSFLAMILAVGWSLSLNPDGIFQAINAMITYLAPPMTCVFLFGVFWRRASATAAASTLIVGAVCGLTLFVLNLLKPSGWMSFVEREHLDFLLQGVFLFLVCVTIMMLVSWRWPQQHTKESAALVWSSPWEPLRSPGWRGLANYKFVSALLSCDTCYYLLRAAIVPDARAESMKPHWHHSLSIGVAALGFVFASRSSSGSGRSIGSSSLYHLLCRSTFFWSREERHERRSQNDGCRLQIHRDQRCRHC